LVFKHLTINNPFLENHSKNVKQTEMSFGNKLNRKNDYKSTNVQHKPTVALDELLKLNSNNHLAWVSRLRVHFSHEDPIIGNFLSVENDGSYKGYTVRPQLEVTQQELDALDVTKAHSDKLKVELFMDHKRQLQRDEQTYKKWFAQILKTLSQAQLDELEKDQAWSVVAANQKPLELVQLIYNRLIWRKSGLPDAEAQDVLLAAYVNCAQADRESPYEYVRRFKHLYQCLIAAKHPQAGDMQAAIRRCVRNLNQKYSAYKTDVFNRAIREEQNAYPADLTKVAELATMYAGGSSSLGTTHNRGITATGFKAEVSKKNWQPATCEHCGKPGHSENNCWAKYPDKMPPSKAKIKQQKRQSTQQKKAARSSQDHKVYSARVLWGFPDAEEEEMGY